jgi:hypothetical protein
MADSVRQDVNGDPGDACRRAARSRSRWGRRRPMSPAPALRPRAVDAILRHVASRRHELCDLVHTSSDFQTGAVVYELANFELVGAHFCHRASPLPCGKNSTAGDRRAQPAAPASARCRHVEAGRDALSGRGLNDITHQWEWLRSIRTAPTRYSRGTTAPAWLERRLGRKAKHSIPGSFHQ